MSVEPNRQFYVIALILGPYLPAEGRRLELDGVTILHLPAEDIQGLPSQRGITGIMAADQFFHVRSPFIQVNSRWALIIPVSALDRNAAQKHAEREVLPDLLAALHTLGGTPYRVEILRVEDPIDPDAARWTPTQSMGMGGPVWVDPLTSRRRETLRRRRRLLSSDTTAAAAAEHLRLGVTLDDYPDPSGAAAQAALLRYYMCIERIVQAITASTRRRRRHELDAERERVAAALAKGLATLDPAEQVASIETACREMRREDLRFADLEVREGARELGINHDATDEAARLAVFRGKHLGHSSLAPMEEVEGWLAGPENRAFRLAASFLGSYLDQLPEPTSPSSHSAVVPR